METKHLVRKLEAEKQEVKNKIDLLVKRAEEVETALREIRRAVGRKVKPARAPRGGKAGKKPATRTKKARMTVRQAILKAVSGASEPLPPAAIIQSAKKLCNGAVASIRTQISILAKGGDLEKVPHPGRGFLYRTPGSGQSAPKKTAKKTEGD